MKRRTKAVRVFGKVAVVQRAAEYIVDDGDGTHSGAGLRPPEAGQGNHVFPRDHRIGMLRAIDFSP